MIAAEDIADLRKQIAIVKETRPIHEARLKPGNLADVASGLHTQDALMAHSLVENKRTCVRTCPGGSGNVNPIWTATSCQFDASGRIGHQHPDSRIAV